MQFAYCVPYAYSQLLKDISALESRNRASSTIFQHSKLCNSLSGVALPLLTIGKFDGAPNKHCVVITARVHPG